MFAQTFESLNCSFYKNNKAPCDSNPCQSSGICSNIDVSPYYSCKCVNGYTGSTCDNSEYLFLTDFNILKFKTRFRRRDFDFVVKLISNFKNSTPKRSMQFDQSLPKWWVV